MLRQAHPVQQPALLSVQVASYNILSPNLGTAETFHKCTPVSLNPVKRYKVLIQKLKTQVAQSAVICLQEVTESWAARLHVWFAKRKYRFISRQYHRYYTGYMGVAIALPVRFEIQELKFVRPNQCIAPKKKTTAMDSCQTRLDFKLRSSPNIAIFLRICVKHRRKKRQSPMTFCISNYHFPCEFKDPDFMVATASLLLKRIQSFAKTDPFIIAGDFNSTPDSATYALIQSGNRISPSSDGKHRIDNLRIYGAPLFSSNENMVPMQSVYAQKNGREPAFTNFSSRKINGDVTHVFCGTIDYIFVSPHWKVLQVLPTPSHARVQGTLASYPTEKEPSDHILIASELTLKR